MRRSDCTRKDDRETTEETEGLRGQKGDEEDKRGGHFFLSFCLFCLPCVLQCSICPPPPPLCSFSCFLCVPPFCRVRRLIVRPPNAAAVVVNRGSQDKWQSIRSVQSFSKGIQTFSVEIVNNAPTPNNVRSLSLSLGLSFIYLWWSCLYPLLLTDLDTVCVCVRLGVCVCLSVWCLCVGVCLCMSVCLGVCLSVRLSVCVCLSLCRTVAIHYRCGAAHIPSDMGWRGGKLGLYRRHWRQVLQCGCQHRVRIEVRAKGRRHHSGDELRCRHY